MYTPMVGPKWRHFSRFRKHLIIKTGPTVYKCTPWIEGGEETSRPLVGGRYLYFDNFCSSLELFDDLLEDNLNGQMPKQLPH